MTDEQFGPLVASWLKAGNNPPPDPGGSVRQTMTVAQQTRQLRRRWWLPPFVHRMPAPPKSPPTTDQTTDYQPTPIPATNGQSATVTGRTQSMFSPVKAVTAGALVFAIGGVLLIAQPFDQQGGSVPGAATDTERAAPVPVTGESRDGPCGGPMPSEIIDGVSHSQSGLCSQTVSFSDPRLEGEATYQFANTEHLDENGVVVVTLGTDALSIVNENGAWRQPPTLFAFDLGSSDDVGLKVLYGEGDYEGLVAVLTATGCDPCTFDGFIIDGDFPPPTETASTK
jgi:hypothetical protein